MIGAALALVVVGLVIIFTLPWVGVPVALVALVLLVLFLIDFCRRAITGRQP